MTAYSRPSTVAAYQSVAAHGAVASADPHRLILMLMDGALERIAQAKGCIRHGMAGERNRLLHAAVSIVEELRSSLNHEAGGSIAANLDSLYEYIGRQLIKANLECRTEPLEEATHLLGEIRSAWVALPPEVRTPGAPAR